jgi:hypothetical protein
LKTSFSLEKFCKVLSFSSFSSEKIIIWLSAFRLVQNFIFMIFIELKAKTNINIASFRFLSSFSV